MKSFACSYLLLLSLCLSIQATALAQGFVWAKPVQAVIPGDRAIPHLQQSLFSQRISVTDRQGNTYVAGIFTNTLTLGSTTVTAQDTLPNLFAAKFDSAGTLKWVQTGYSTGAGTRLGAEPTAITLDAANRPLLTVRAPTSLTINGTSKSGTNYIVSFDTAGGLRWIRPIGRIPGVLELPDLTDIQLAPNGDILLAGDAGYAWVSVAVLFVCDSTGRIKWMRMARPVSNPNSVWGGRALADNAGHYYLMGVSEEGAYLCDSTGGNYTMISGYGFLAQYDTTGNLLWHKTIDGKGEGIASDGAGNVYWAGEGSYQNSLDSLQATAGFFLAKISASGRTIWLRGPDHEVIQMGQVEVGDLLVDAVGNVTLVGSYATDSLSIGGRLLPAPNSADVLAVRFRNDGQVGWIETGGGAGNDVGVLVSADQRNNLYIYGQTTSPTGFGGFALQSTPPGSARFGNGFLTKLRRPADWDRLTGVVYVDANANGLRDPGEKLFPRVLELTEVRSGQSLLAQGSFELIVDTGRYDLRPTSSVPYYTIGQGAAGYQGHFTQLNQVDTARHFGLAPVANQPDMRVTLTPYSRARRGFANRYRARIENVGTTTVGGTLTVQFDPQLIYSGAQPPPGQSTTTTATWSFANLAPFGILDYDVAATPPITVPLGTLVHSAATVTVTGDLNLANNTEQITQLVTGSYDPNDLTVNYAYLTPAQVAAGTPLDYTIRFQNQGTDTAFSVVITDTLPAHLLQVGTLNLLGGSHRGMMDGRNNVLTVRFDNISLPPASTSIPNSMGFVRFEVVPSTTLQPGAVIPNTAHITFDYNAPLATNEVTTLVQTANGLVAEPGATPLNLYPNPADGSIAAVTLTADLPIAGTVAVRLLDPLGRVVREQRFAAAAGALRRPLAVGDLPAGLYVVRLTLPGCTTASRKLVVR